MTIFKKIAQSVKWKIISIKNRAIIAKLRCKVNLKALSSSTERNPRIIVSLTSYAKRFPTLDICLKSLLNQTLLPDRLILYLSKREDVSNIPKRVKKLKKYGLEIKFVDDDLKPHKKYYYAIQEFPNDIIITVDDDVVYDKNLIKSLYDEYLKFPNCVIAARAHKITFKNNKVQKYKDWEKAVSQKEVPSFLFLPTGVGGVLYPPHVFKRILFDKEYIASFLTVDDLWLKNVEILSDVPVVICNPEIDKNRIEIPSAQRVGLFKKNVDKNNNDIFIKKLEQYFCFSKNILQAEKELKKKYE